MSVLSWPEKLLAEDDLRRRWTGEREIVLGAKTIVTPLALDFLRGKRIAIRRENASDIGVSIAGGWGIALESPHSLLAAALKALANEGLSLVTLENAGKDKLAWVKSLAKRIAEGKPPGALLVSEHAALAACVANKTHGIRAAVVSQPGEVRLLKATLGPNLFTVAAAGRTYFELRQIVKLATASPPVSPLGEIDDAHR